MCKYFVTLQSKKLSLKEGMSKNHMAKKWWSQGLHTIYLAPESTFSTINGLVFLFLKSRAQHAPNLWQYNFYCVTEDQQLIYTSKNIVIWW